MNIPDKAYEAAYDSSAARAYLDGEDLEVIARAVLEAAAPYLCAQALRDFARTLDDNTLVDAQIIHETADELGPHE